MAKHYRCMNLRCKARGMRHPVKKKTCACGAQMKYPRSKKGMR